MTTKVLVMSLADLRRNQSPRTDKSHRRVGFQMVSSNAWSETVLDPETGHPRVTPDVARTR